MAGYCDYSMSNNAINAYNEGRMPASRLARVMGITAADVREAAPAEWHHTSKEFNCTNFYDCQAVVIALLKKHWSARHTNLIIRRKLRRALRYVNARSAADRADARAARLLRRSNLLAAWERAKHPLRALPAAPLNVPSRESSRLADQFSAANTLSRIQRDRLVSQVTSAIINAQTAAYGKRARNFEGQVAAAVRTEFGYGYRQK